MNKVGEVDETTALAVTKVSVQPTRNGANMPGPPPVMTKYGQAKLKAAQAREKLIQIMKEMASS